MDPEHFARGRGAAARRAATRLALRGAAAIAMRVLERAGEELAAALVRACRAPRTRRPRPWR
jgi:hypothetical protein